MADYTAKELHEVMLKIFNSDKEGGYTSKEMKAIFGQKTKAEILKFEPDELMAIVKSHADLFTIKQGSILRHRGTKELFVCTKNDHSLSSVVHLVGVDGTARQDFRKYYEVVGEFNVNVLFKAIEANLYNNTKTSQCYPFDVGDLICRKEEGNSLTDVALGLEKGRVVYCSDRQMRIYIIKHKDPKYHGETFWGTNTEEYYAKI